MSYKEVSNITKEKNVTLVAVSKTRSVMEIKSLYDAGQKIFGENKVQELLSKQPLLPSDVQWHLIGHLQSNKVKQILPFVTLIHSVDSYNLLEIIEKEAQLTNRIVKVLLQIKVAQEDSKFGMDLEEAENTILKYNSGAFKFTIIQGIMGMATLTADKDQIRVEFKKLSQIFNHLKSKLKLNQKEFNQLSMGMSGDYDIAIEEGATMVRIGSLLFH